jgi:plastocyanin
MIDTRARQEQVVGGSRRTRSVVVTLCGVALAAMTACGSSSGTGDPVAGASSSAPAPAGSPTAAPAAAGSASPSPAELVVHIEDFAYRVPTSVSPGAMVSVMNMDGEAHTVTADDGSAFDVQVGADATGTFTAPTTPGSYPFHCTYHGNMHGVLVVK